MAPSSAKPADQAVEIGRHQRLDVGVGADGVEALELAHLRRDLGRDRDRQVGRPRQQRIAHALLVIAVQVGVNKSDRDALIAGSNNAIAEG